MLDVYQLEVLIICLLHSTMYQIKLHSQDQVTLYLTYLLNNEIITCFLTIFFYKLWQVLVFI